MSGDTPTADGIPHSLDCPDCSSAVFARPVAHWTHGESEYCPGCGSSLRVSLEEHDGDPDELTAVAVSYEHGGEVVARLLADTERLSDQLTQDENDRKECETGAIERDRMRKEFAATIERLTRNRDLVWAERVEEGKVAARAGREAAELRTRAEQDARTIGDLDARVELIREQRGRHVASIEELTEELGEARRRLSRDEAEALSGLLSGAEAEVERLTRNRDLVWAERVEEGKVAARAGREAARLADMLAVSEARLTECQGLLASERESSASIAAGFEQLAAKLDAHEALAEVQITRLTEERSAAMARSASDGRVIIKMGKRNAEHMDEAAHLRDQLGEARAVAQEWRSKGWGDPLGKYKFPWEIEATPPEPGNAEYIAWSDGGMVGPAPGHGEPDQ